MFGGVFWRVGVDVNDPEIPFDIIVPERVPVEPLVGRGKVDPKFLPGTTFGTLASDEDVLIFDSDFSVEEVGVFVLMIRFGI